jgi:hypothetical protein
MRVEYIPFDFSYLLDLHNAVGTLQTAVLISQPSDGEEYKKFQTKNLNDVISEYRENHKNPNLKLLYKKNIKHLLKGCLKMFRRCFKKGVPSHLLSAYNEIATDVNNTISELESYKMKFHKVDLLEDNIFTILKMAQAPKKEDA